jgi:hypothetical protein
MKKIFITTLLLFLSIILPYSFFQQKSKNYIDMAQRITGKVARTLEKKYNMHAIGIGEGMKGSVNWMKLAFEISQPLSKKEATKIVVDCLEEYLNAINEDEQIRPYLKIYPFTTLNAEIEIYSRNSSTGELFLDPFIGIVHARRGKINYITKEKGKIEYKTDYEEDYEEALKSLKEND